MILLPDPIICGLAEEFVEFAAVAFGRSASAAFTEAFQAVLFVLIEFFLGGGFFPVFRDEFGAYPFVE